VIIVVQTEALAAEWAREVGRASVRVIPLASGSDAGHTDRRECRRLLDLPEDKPIIAVIGCLTPAKGYIELFESIKGMQKDFRVLLIGDTPAWISPNPAEIAQEAGWLADTIFRKNFVPESQMPSLFGAIDAAALLYRKPNGSSGILSLCRQFGVPVIATCFGEIGALVRSERLGITANPADPEAVRLAIAHVLASDSDKTPNGTTAKSGGRSWAATGEAHALLYSELQGVERQGDRTTGDSVEQLGR
jgi:glycosyltransferase involved in cell wall biosynthesis